MFDEETVACLASAFADAAPYQSRRLGFLSQCLEHLEGRARRLCELRYQQDLKPATIGETVGMTANAVAKALQRIRDQLRHCIEDKFAAEGVG